MAVTKIVIGLSVLAVGGTGTYLTYDYLNNKSSTTNQNSEKIAKVLSEPEEDSGENCSGEETEECPEDTECVEEEETCKREDQE